MDKLELWRKGDRLTATKLNDALQAVNCLIDAENNRLDKAASSANGAEYKTISYNESVPNWYQDITPLWNQDGEAVIYDSWDGLGDLTKEAGLYNRQVGINAIMGASYTDDATLNLIKPDADIRAGQQVVQEITIDANGSITANNIMIYESLQDIPQATINPLGESKIYRRLSRIISDCSNGSTESMPQPSAAWLYKAVATNDFTFSPITVPAIYSAATYSDIGACNSLGLSCQVAQMVRQEGIFSKIKGIQNRGGLLMTDEAKVVKLSSGIEFYSASDSTGQGATFTNINKGLVPYPECVTIAEFPISYNLYEFCHEAKEYRNTKSNNNGSLKITAQPLRGNGWQWGFTYSGDISVDNYRYMPADNEGGKITLSEGDGISITGTGSPDYTISRNLYLEASDSIENEVENAISISCKKVGGKITYSLYAPKVSPCTYEFDPEFFIVSCNSISLNQAALYAIAEEVASEIEVEVQACGIIDTISSGKIKTTTQGLSTEGEQYTATTRASVVSC